MWATPTRRGQKRRFFQRTRRRGLSPHRADSKRGVSVAPCSAAVRVSNNPEKDVLAAHPSSSIRVFGVLLAGVSIFLQRRSQLVTQK